MSNTITITNRGDSSQSIGETNKLIARIAVLEDRLTKLTDKSSKQADMMGKGYASAEAKVKHFEKALKDASNVRMKFAALEGLQKASREFNVAKADFESSMQIGHNPGVVVDTVIEATKNLGAVRANEWAAEQTRQMSFAALQQDMITRSKEQLAVEQRLATERAAATQTTKMADHANQWNAEQSRMLQSKALQEDMIARSKEQIAVEQKLASARAATAQASKMADHVNAWNAEKAQLRESIDLRNELISRMSAQVAVEKQLGQEKQVEAAKRLGAERANQWAADQSRQMQSKAFQEDLIARSREHLVVEKQIAEAKSATTQASRAAEHANQWNAEQLRKFDQRQSSKGIQGRLSSEAEAERKAQQERAKDMIGRLGAWQQSPQRSTMSSQLFEWQQKEKQASDAARRQEMLERDAGAQEQQMRIARARELDAKYASRYMSESFNASSLRGTGTFDSENALKDRRSLLQDRKAGLSPGSESFQKTIDELRQIEVMLKRINAKPMKAVELGSAKALRQQIKYLEAEMAKIGAGQQWNRMNQQLSLAKHGLNEIAERSRNADRALSDAAQAPIGSFANVTYSLERAKHQLTLLTGGTREFLAQQHQVATLQTEWDQLNASVNRTTHAQREGGGVMQTMLGQATALLSSYAGAYQIIATITDEWKKQRDLKLEMSQMGRSMEDVLHRQAVNIGADNLGEAKVWARSNQRRKDNNRGFSASQEGMLDVLGYAMSSGASFDVAKRYALDAMEVSKGEAELAKERVLAGVSIAKKNNSKNLMAGMGQYDAAAQMAQGADNIAFIQNTMDKMAVVTNGTRNLNPMTSEQALEWFTTGTRVMTDSTGEETAGNIARAYVDMSDFNPKTKFKAKNGEILRTEQAKIDQLMAMRDFTDRMKFIAMPGNESLARQYEDSGRKGMPRNMLGVINSSQQWQKELRVSEAAIPAFADSEAFARKNATKLKTATPIDTAERDLQASDQFAKTAPEAQPFAKAVATWTDMFEGSRRVNFTGIDSIQRIASYRNRTAEVAGMMTASPGTSMERAEIIAMISETEKLRKREDWLGNSVAAKSLEGSRDVLVDMLEQLRKLNASVESAKNRPADRLTNVDPKLRVPPVPRVPIAIGKGTNDPFGMRKR